MPRQYPAGGSLLKHAYVLHKLMGVMDRNTPQSKEEKHVWSFKGLNLMEDSGHRNREILMIGTDINAREEYTVSIW